MQHHNNTFSPSMADEELSHANADSAASSGIKIPIYMDYASTTPVDPLVLSTMLPYWADKFGNPHSRTHVFGWRAEEAVENSRAKIAKVINASPKEIIFTSGATEANNLAIKGVANFYKGQKNHIITAETEHKCVLDVLRHLQENGFVVTYLPVNRFGIINLNQLRDAITDQTVLVSIMYVNNETGVMQPIADIGKICRDKSIFFHCDIAQAFGKIEIDVDQLNIDLASISSHKIYGPQGIGALYVRRKPRVRLDPIFNGGGQERGMRSGTVPTALAVGFGVAAEIAQKSLYKDFAHIALLGDHFIESVISRIDYVYLNGLRSQSFPGIINLSFAYVEGESLILALRDLAISSGSACTSASLEPSYILAAMDIDETLSHTSIRFSFGKFTTISEVDYAIELLVEKVAKLRDMSPLWEMTQDGIDITKIDWVHH